MYHQELMLFLFDFFFDLVQVGLYWVCDLEEDQVSFSLEGTAEVLSQVVGVVVELQAL